LTSNHIGPEEYPFSNAFPRVHEFGERGSSILILPELLSRQTVDRISCDEYYSYDQTRHVFESFPIEMSSNARLDTFRRDEMIIGSSFVHGGNTFTILSFGVERKHSAATDTISIPPLPYSDFLALTDSATYYEYDSPRPVTLSSYISTACIRQNKLWVGFAGGYPEGVGDPGGLAVLDLRRGHWEVVWKAELIKLDITGIVLFADTLIWMST
jgi:hypothetical protein